MIKFFQKLKAKKGFTLVELIVVIAIIGVLAAILVPTMLGYVTSSRVTSANSTAASIKNNVDTFLTNADTNGYGMMQGSAINDELDITITGSAWTCTGAATANYKVDPTITWGAGASGMTKDTSKVGITSAEELLCIELAQLFPEVEQGSVHIVLNGGKCVAVAYTADVSSVMTAGTDFPAVAANAAGALEFTMPYAWDTKTAGVNAAGFIVGTAPTVELG